VAVHGDQGSGRAARRSPSLRQPSSEGVTRDADSRESGQLQGQSQSGHDAALRDTLQLDRLLHIHSISHA